VTSPLVGIRIDIETRSSNEVSLGSYRYSESDDFRVLVISYAPLRRVDGEVQMGKPRLLPLWDKQMVARFQQILLDPKIEKHAFNANFERVCLSRWMGWGTGTYFDPRNWRCTAVQSSVAGIQGRLEDVARAVRSPITKDSEGKRLIRLFSKPDKKTGRFHCLRHKPEGSTFYSPLCWCGANHREDFEHFERYCMDDVMTEAAVAHLLPRVPDQVQAEYEMDQTINDTGYRHHKRMSEMAVVQVAAHKKNVMAALRASTGIDNPNSVKQFMTWLETKDYPMVSLDKAHRAEALADPFIPKAVADALILKGQASLTSVTKHKAALATRCTDGRIRGSLGYYGAHTGREAGRGIQPQNLPRAEASVRDAARLLHGKAGADAPEIAKGTVRGTIIPARDHLFATLDYNAIEARVLGGLAGEQWVLDEFNPDKGGLGKIYEATAAKLFGLDKFALIAALKSCGKCGICPECITRGQGKVSELAGGYAGGAGAFVTMGAAAAGIDVGNYPELNAQWKAEGMPGKFFDYKRDEQEWPELLRLRDLYREARPQTVRFWKLCAAAWDAASRGETTQFGNQGCLTFMRDGRHNRLILPSGRSIWYRHARSHEDPERPERIDRRTFIGKRPAGVGHARIDTHGGKLTENVTQAVARDCLFDLMMRMQPMIKAGWPGRIVLHVHDEVVIEAPKASAAQCLADVDGMMSESPAWGTIFPLKGEGKLMERYAK